MSKELNYSWLLEFESIKNWEISLRSTKTKELYFRTLHNLISNFLSNPSIKNPDDLLKLDDRDAIDLIRKFSYSYTSSGKQKMGELAKTILKSFYLANSRELKSPHLKVHKVPRSSKTYNRIVPIKEQVYQLADASMGLRDRALILVMWQSGLRNSTIRNLRVGHVKDLLLKSESSLRIDITTDIDKKSLGEAYYTFIANDGIDALRNYLSTRGKLEDISGEEPLFLSNLPGTVRPLTDVGVLRILKRAAKRAGLDPKRIWPHCLRASFYNMLVGRVDDTLREFLFGHGIGIRTHYFAPQQVDKVKEAYSAVDWNRTKIVKVEELKEEREKEKQILLSRIADLQSQLNRLSETRRESDSIMDRLFEDSEFKGLLARKLKEMKV